MPDPTVKEKKTWKNGSERFEKYQEYRERGLIATEAGKLAGYNPDYTFHAESRLKKLNILQPKRIKKTLRYADTVIDKATKGDTDYLAAATSLTKEIWDRHDPKIQKIEQKSESFSVSVHAHIRDAMVDSLRRCKLIPAEAKQAEIADESLKIAESSHKSPPLEAELNGKSHDKLCQAVDNNESE